VPAGSGDEVTNLEALSAANALVYMWALEDGDMLTGDVKPWPCTVTSCSTVKLMCPKPGGRSFATNEKAWGLVFSAFLNTPGTPFRSKLRFTPENKLTPGTGYRAASLDARVVRIAKGDEPEGGGFGGERSRRVSVEAVDPEAYFDVA